MPQPATVPALTPQQALYILEKLIDEKAVSAADVRRHLGGMWQEMTTLEKRIAELRGLASNAHPIRRIKQAIKERIKRTRRRKPSPQIAASQKLQGQYLGYIRQIPKRNRKKYQDLAKTKGREAAITAMKKHLGK